jgi:DNA-binding beta-propeller fold protein YncE
VLLHAEGCFLSECRGCADAPGTTEHTFYCVSIDGTTGLPTSIGTVAAGNDPVFVTVHPSGKFAYAADFMSIKISMYTVDATTGHLTPIGAVSTTSGPKSIAIDPSGNYAYAAEYSGYVDAYTVDLSTGALSPGSSTSDSSYPSTVTVSPSGKFTYVANSGDCDFVPGSVSQYSINPAFNGELSYSATIGAGFCSIGMAVDPLGKFAYVTNSGDNNISMFGINSSTGLLSSTGLVAAGTAPWSIAIDPSGRFVYVTNLQSNDISIYSIDLATGSLTLIGTISS